MSSRVRSGPHVDSRNHATRRYSGYWFADCFNGV